MKNIQTNLFDFESEYNADDSVSNVRKLISMHQRGLLGGEVMPEDARPSDIVESSRENLLFLTLPMALNYQRNSYKLWESAARMFEDNETRMAFFPECVVELTDETLLSYLTKYKVALQPNRHLDIWRKVASGLNIMFENDVENIFKDCDYDVLKIKETIQVTNKKVFPYLSGHKIFNYWLYVMESYSPVKFKNRNEITIAPDTHIIQASLKLKVVRGDFDSLAQDRMIVADAWKDLLKDTEIAPIDVHTPLWLWSRKGFPPII